MTTPPVGFRLIVGVGVEDKPVIPEPIVVLVSVTVHELVFDCDVDDVNVLSDKVIVTGIDSLNRHQMKWFL